MKRIIFPLVIVAIFFCNACSSPQQKPEATDKQTKTAADSTNNKPDFSGLKFASDIDVNCGMPLSYGVGDTATYDGKLYGFCSKECKDEFLKDPTAAIKKK